MIKTYANWRPVSRRSTEVSECSPISI
uniref:Uncharacterized protein n=1 Tax=Arundo donax TaxID=35708 RepID=A0A0A8XRF7_ARUDO